MLLCFMDIGGIYRPMWLFNDWYIWTFWLIIIPEKQNQHAFIWSIFQWFAIKFILLNNWKCPYLSLLDLKWFKHAMQHK